MKQVWACSQCRSINDRRRSRCYKCLTPREQVEVDPMIPLADVLAAIHGPSCALPPYQPATIRAVVAGSLIASASGLSVLGTINATLLVRQLVDSSHRAVRGQEQYLAIMAPWTGRRCGRLRHVRLLAEQGRRHRPGARLGYTRVALGGPLRGPLPLGLLASPAALRSATYRTSWHAQAAILDGRRPAGYLRLARRVPPVIWDLMRRLDPTSGRAGILDRRSLVRPRARIPRPTRRGDLRRGQRWHLRRLVRRAW